MFYYLICEELPFWGTLNKKKTVSDHNCLGEQVSIRGSQKKILRCISAPVDHYLYTPIANIYTWGKNVQRFITPTLLQVKIPSLKHVYYSYSSKTLIFLDLILLARKPKTKSMESITFDFPLPFGPTIDVKL
jgi:hypothetical protein